MSASIVRTVQVQTTETYSTPKKESRLNNGQIGAIAGGSAGVVAAAAIAWTTYRRRKAKTAPYSPSLTPSSSLTPTGRIAVPSGSNFCIAYES